MRGSHSHALLLATALLASCSHLQEAAPAQAPAPVAPGEAEGATQPDAPKLAPVVAEALEACARGDDARCGWLADRAQAGVARLHPGEHLRAFERGCAAGSPNGCAGLTFAQMAWTPGAVDLPALRERARGACDQGSSAGCALEASRRLATFTGQEREEAVRWAQAQCERLGGQVCQTVAEQLPEPQAIASLQRACDTGAPSACFAWAQKLRGDLPTEALGPNLERGCDAHFGPACLALSFGVIKGTPVGARVVELWERACDTGAPEACDLLVETNQGRFHPASPLQTRWPDPLQREAALRVGCERGGWQSCLALAAPHLVPDADGSDQESPQHYERALPFVQMACWRGRAASCETLRGIVRGATRGCDEAQNPRACHMKAVLLRQGVRFPPGLDVPHVPQDAAASDRALAKACALGRTAACEGGPARP